jgi:O-antigen ligase
MTEMMFRNMRSVPTYALIMVALIALTTPRPQRVAPPGG